MRCFTGDVDGQEYMNTAEELSANAQTLCKIAYRSDGFVLTLIGNPERKR